MIRALKTPPHLKMHIVVYTEPYIRIGTLVVVYKRGVIERQSHVRLVVPKAIIANVQAQRKVSRQKQCDPAPNHYFIFVESPSCKNSETSCLEARRKFDSVKQLTKSRYCTRIVQIHRCKPMSPMRPSNARYNT